MQETPILIAHGLAEIISSNQSIKLRKVIQAFQKYIGSHMYSTNVTEVFKRFLELHFSRYYTHEKKPDLNKKYVCDAIKVGQCILLCYCNFTIFYFFVFRFYFGSI